MLSPPVWQVSLGSLADTSLSGKLLSNYVMRVQLEGEIKVLLCNTAISLQDIEDHIVFVITVPTALAIFLTIFVLACIESIFKKLLRVFSLVIWACLVAMGYLFMFFGGIICPWDQVRLSALSAI